MVIPKEALCTGFGYDIDLRIRIGLVQLTLNSPKRAYFLFAVHCLHEENSGTHVLPLKPH